MLPKSSLSLLLIKSSVSVVGLRTLHQSCCHRNRNAIQKVVVIGGGTMGSGISQLFAQSGIPVTVIDCDDSAQKCMVKIRKSLQVLSEKKFPNEPRAAQKFINDVFSCIKTTQCWETGMKDADLVIEAVIESLTVKQNLFKKVDLLAPVHAILASNTSSLSIQEIGGVMSQQDRFMGLHFFNPVEQMRAVEVIMTEKTSPDVVAKIEKIISDVGKLPVRCRENKENAGFIVNSLLYPFLMEALRLYETGHASVENIDRAMKLGLGLPHGPFEMMDIIGIDSVKFVIDRWHTKYPDNPKYFPSPTLDKLAGENKLGKKSGQGFYVYHPKVRL